MMWERRTPLQRGSPCRHSPSEQSGCYETDSHRETGVHVRERERERERETDRQREVILTYITITLSFGNFRSSSESTCMQCTWHCLYKMKRWIPKKFPEIFTLFSVFCACGTTMMGSSSSVVRTVSLLPRVNIVERFLKVVRVEKKPRLGVSSAPIRSSFSATSSYYNEIYT